MPDLQPYYNYIIAAVAVLAILWIVIFLLKQMQRMGRGRKGNRLGVVEYNEVDQTRRLILVRRDNVEHLLLIGGAHDLVVESGIEHPHRREAAGLVPAKPEGIVPLRSPRAPAFAPRKPALQSVPADPPLGPADDEPTPA